MRQAKASASRFSSSKFAISVEELVREVKTAPVSASIGLVGSVCLRISWTLELTWFWPDARGGECGLVECVAPAFPALQFAR